MAVLMRSAVPTGTVDLVTKIVYFRMLRPNVRATSSTWRRSAEPSSSGGVPTAEKTTSTRSETIAEIGREVQSACVDVALDQLAQPGFVNRYLACEQPFDFRAVDVDACHVDAHFGEAGSRDEADIAGSNDSDVHDESRL